MNLFVHHLSPETTAEDLQELFSEFGKVSSVKLIRDPDSGLSRGFGFVIMKDTYEAFNAIDNLDKIYFKGSVISVKESRPRDRDARPAGRAKKS